MTRRTLLLGSLAIAAHLALTGCSKSERIAFEDRPLKSALLFGPDRAVSLWSTQMGRNPWPTVDDGYRLPEVSVAQEYYYDATGNRFNEQNFPRRTTWGYKVTGVQR